MTHAATDVSTAMTPHPIEVSPVSPRLDRTPAEKLPPYFTKTQLNRNRRWTFTEIDAFLGEPDLEKGTGDTTAKLYDKVRVLEVERRREWLDVATRLPQVPLPSWSHESPHGYYRVKDLMDRGWYRADIDMFLGNICCPISFSTSRCAHRVSWGNGQSMAIPAKRETRTSLASLLT